MDSELTIGIIGGGQLGRMLLQSAISFSVKCRVYDPHVNAPVQPFCQDITCGAFDDTDAIIKWGQTCDIITYEIEHISVEALKTLKSQGKRIVPDPDILAMIQDKGHQKEFFLSHSIPSAPFKNYQSPKHIGELKWPKVIKSRRFGYDGKGVWVVKDKSELSTIPDQPIIVEDTISIWKECAITVVRNGRGECELMPIVEVVYHDDHNMVDYLIAPADIGIAEQEAIRSMALQIAEKCQLIGILAIEWFITHDKKLLVNEMAPRPHNSGHHTIEALPSSQFDQLMRCLLNLSLGSTTMIRQSAMVNIIGSESESNIHDKVKPLYQMPNVHVHLYGKQWKPFRKMGHITICSDNKPALLETVKTIKEELEK